MTPHSHAIATFSDRVEYLLADTIADLDALDGAVATIAPSLAGMLSAHRWHIEIVRGVLEGITEALDPHAPPAIKRAPVPPLDTVSAVIGTLARASTNLADALVNLAELDGIITNDTPYLTAAMSTHARYLEFAKRDIDKSVDTVTDTDDSPPPPRTYNTGRQDRMQINEGTTR